MFNDLDTIPPQSLAGGDVPMSQCCHQFLSVAQICIHPYICTSKSKLLAYKQIYLAEAELYISIVTTSANQWVLVQGSQAHKEVPSLQSCHKVVQAITDCTSITRFTSHTSTTILTNRTHCAGSADETHVADKTCCISLDNLQDTCKLVREA